MKRSNRISRRGGSRPGTRVVNPTISGNQVAGDQCTNICQGSGKPIWVKDADCTCETAPKRRFSGDRSQPVIQRQIMVNPSQGGFFAMPQDERNYGQNNSLPQDEQLNACGGYSNFGSNTPQNTWSGAQSNVGPQSRVFAGSYASGGYSNFGSNTPQNTWSGAQSNVGPQDRIYGGNFASGSNSAEQTLRSAKMQGVKGRAVANGMTYYDMSKVAQTTTTREGKFLRHTPINSGGMSEESCTTCEDEYGKTWCATFSSPCNAPKSCEPCNAGAEMVAPITKHNRFGGSYGRR